MMRRSPAATIQLALVDDEPLITDRIVAHAKRAGRPGVDVHVFRRPRRLDSHPAEIALTHAVVDLSFGVRDIDHDGVRDEPETGVDAISRLTAVFPMCKTIVATRRDNALLAEMTVAIRQTWPEVRFLHKSDERFLERLDRFLDWGTVTDNAEFLLDLTGVDPKPPARIRVALASTMYASTCSKVLLELAEATRQPSAKQLAARCNNAEPYVKKIVQEIGFGLHNEGFLAQPKYGLERLWLWARARRAILRTEFAEDLQYISGENKGSR
jgi:hypothetical protein